MDDKQKLFGIESLKNRIKYFEEEAAHTDSQIKRHKESIQNLEKIKQTAISNIESLEVCIKLLEE